MAWILSYGRTLRCHCWIGPTIQADWLIKEQEIINWRRCKAVRSRNRKWKCFFDYYWWYVLINKHTKNSREIRCHENKIVISEDLCLKPLTRGHRPKLDHSHCSLRWSSVPVIESHQIANFSGVFRVFSDKFLGVHIIHSERKRKEKKYTPRGADEGQEVQLPYMTRRGAPLQLLLLVKEYPVNITKSNRFN